MSTFPPMLAIDDNGDILHSATGQIFATSDLTASTPLAITDLYGNPLTGLRLDSSPIGVLPGFKGPSALAVDWVSGSFRMTIPSIDMIPIGGNAGQALVKNSSGDFDYSWQDVAAAGGGTVDTSGLEPKHWTISAPTTESAYRSLDLLFQPDTTNPNTSEISVQGVLTQWFNEWGGLRGTPTPAFKDDSLVRGIRRSDLGAGSVGNFIEYEDRTFALTDPRRKAWGVRWRDGVINRNGIDMALCYVRYGATALPTYLPDGTVIVTVND